MENREKILKCALELFYARGYDAVGVQEISAGAGVTKPTLYHYFGSKCGLLKVLLEKSFTHLNTEIRKAAQYEGDVPATLYRVTDRLIDIANGNRKMYMLLMALFFSAKDNEAYQAVRPWMKEFNGIIFELFDQAGDQLGNMRGRQRQFAMGFLGILHQYILFMCEELPVGSQVSSDVKYQLVHQFMHGIHV